MSLLVFLLPMKCPCRSGLKYSDCCKPLHKGEAALENALQLMRSRYSAYVLGDVSYIITTTHPKNFDYTEDKASWGISILQFSHKTTFEDLEILDFSEEGDEAFVTFSAKLSQDGQDTSFEEKSRFLKKDGRWLYHSAT